VSLLSQYCYTISQHRFAGAFAGGGKSNIERQLSFQPTARRVPQIKENRLVFAISGGVGLGNLQNKLMSIISWKGTGNMSFRTSTALQ